nr:ATP-binding protein [Comamonas testosteroni]
MSQRDDIRIFVQLGLWALHLLLALVWLAHLDGRAHPWLWGASALAALAAALMMAWYAARTYRVLLWRRRKSIRPSREVQAERRRMAAALHDGLGSQLVHATALAEAHKDKPLQQMLEQCLLDLRLIVDSMDAEDDALSLRLARFRHRLQGVLDHRGIALHWDVWDPEIVGEEGQLPRGSMAQNIMAILQEAVSNILQHAAAQEIWITLAPSAAQAVADAPVHASLCIEDDGRGIPQDLAEQAGARVGRGGSGMGLANMFRRASEIGAELEIHAREGGGSKISLRW